MLQQQQQVRMMRGGKGLGNKIDPWKGTGGAIDLTLTLGDEMLMRILGLLPLSPYPYSQVCKRWLRLQGLLRHSIKVHDWGFLESGRLSWRFPNLTDIDLTTACLAPPLKSSPSSVLFTHQFLSVHLDLDAYDPFSIEQFIQDQQLSPSTLDKGLKVLADSFPGLQRLCLVDVRSKSTPRNSSNGTVFCEPAPLGISKDGNAGESVTGKDADKTLDEDFAVDGENVKSQLDSKNGLVYIAKECHTLQELELHQCTDDSLSAISACKNLQIVRLVGSVNGYFHCTFTDIGLTILARTCSRLVKLDLSGCEASYDGIAAIGHCCLMLEELTISTQGFFEGWVAALSFCMCLKTLRLENCKQIDPAPGPLEHLGHCMALEHLQLVRCDLRDEAGFRALMMVSLNVRDLEFQDCWGLDDETFAAATACRRLKLLALEGCSPLTTAGLEAVALTFKDLQALRVVYCSNIKDTEISPDLALLFCTLKELKWRPDARSLLSRSLAGTGIGQQGGKFFKKGGPS